MNKHKISIIEFVEKICDVKLNTWQKELLLYLQEHPDAEFRHGRGSSRSGSQLWYKLISDMYQEFIKEDT